MRGLGALGALLVWGAAFSAKAAPAQQGISTSTVSAGAPSRTESSSMPDTVSPRATGAASGGAGLLDGAPLTLSGFFQFDYVRLDRSSDQLSDGSGEPLNEDRFFVRSGRLRLEGDWTYAGFVTEAELNTIDGPTVGLRWLLGLIKWPGVDSDEPLVQLGAGVFPVPFGFEMHLQAHFERFFGERTLLSRAFVPGRFDVGIGVSGRYRWLVYSLAAQNGEPLGERSFPGTDPNAAKDFAGRVGVDTQLTSWLRVSGAVSVLRGTGFSAGRPPTKDDFVWRDFNEDGQVSPSELQPVKGSAAVPSENFERFALGADFQLVAQVPYLGEAWLYGEIATGVNIDRGVSPADPGLTGRDQRSRGFYVAFTQEVLEYAMIGVRYDFYEPDADETDQQGGTPIISRRPFETLTVGVAGLLPLGDVRARLLLELVTEQNSLARDAAGVPAPLDNDSLRARLQVVF